MPLRPYVLAALAILDVALLHRVYLSVQLPLITDMVSSYSYVLFRVLRFTTFFMLHRLG